MPRANGDKHGSPRNGGIQAGVVSGGWWSNPRRLRQWRRSVSATTAAPASAAAPALPPRASSLGLAALLGRMTLGAVRTPTVGDRRPAQVAVLRASCRRCRRRVVATEGGCVLLWERDGGVVRAPRVATRVMIPVGTQLPIGHPEVAEEDRVRGPIVVDAMADHTRRVFRHVSTGVTRDAGCRCRPPPPPSDGAGAPPVDGRVAIYWGGGGAAPAAAPPAGRDGPALAPPSAGPPA